MNKLIISSLLPNDILNELSELGFVCLKAGKTANINNETAYHPDMLFFKLLCGSLLTEKGFVHTLDTFVNCLESGEKLDDKYPSDCIFNCFYADNNLFCGKNTAKEILEDAIVHGVNIVKVKQGYAACSTVRLSNNAYITSDTGIAAALKALGFDVLIVSNNGITLNGYNNGFIGGCALFVLDGCVGFSGAIENHCDYDAIKGFCRNHHIEPYSLSKSLLYDYGGGIIIN